MKFYELDAGQRFEYEGEIYTKINHVLSHHEQSGEKQLIRRSAEVSLVGGAGPTTPAAPAPKKELDQDLVLAAFDTFYNHCLQCVLDMAGKVDPQTLAEADNSLKQARQHFIDTIISER